MQEWIDLVACTIDETKGVLDKLPEWLGGADQFRAYTVSKYGDPFVGERWIWQTPLMGIKSWPLR